MAYISFSSLGQDPAPKRHGYVRPVVPDLLEDCPYRIVRGVRPSHESLFRVHQK